MQALSAFSIHMFNLILLFLSLGVNTMVCGQKKWDGEGGDSLWNTSLNWVDNIVPSPADDVLLDHSVLSGNYVVKLPSGVIGVSIRTLTIFPDASQTIEVLLPATNTAIPGFSAIGSLYGLVIYPGGVFRNSSGAAAGTPVEISDSIRINNGGLYIHNTSRAHASNVTVLSRIAGTEEGTFEFDVPGGAGYTVSIAGRVYGKMILSAVAAGGTKSYASTGTTDVQINSQFRINPGVNYSLNFNGAFIIQGDFFHHGYVFDISSGAHSNTVSLKKNIQQSGLITESGTGSPVIEFNGNTTQFVALSGGITENNTIRVNNAAGITLQSPLTVSHKMELVNGSIKTTPSNILIIQDNAACTGGSVNSFINGPLRKIGDDDFEFPTGKPGNYAPITISGGGGMVTDEFEAEYFLGNPSALFGKQIEQPPIVRVSGLEYWNVARISGSSHKKITASVRTYSHATMLEKLVISRWDTLANTWRSEGNSGYAGFATGSVSSGIIQTFGIFTVASTVVDQNPLPLLSAGFTVRKQANHALLSWQMNSSAETVHFEVLRSCDPINFIALKKIEAVGSQLNYQFVEELPAAGLYYYRLKATEKNGSIHLSNIEVISYQKTNPALLSCHPTIISNRANLFLSASEKMLLLLVMVDARGRIVQRISTEINQGFKSIALEMSNLAAGIYYMYGLGSGSRTNVIRIVKL